MVEHTVVVLWWAAITAKTWEARLIAVRVKRELRGKRRRSGFRCNSGCCRWTDILGFGFSWFGDGRTLFLWSKPGLGYWCSRLHSHPGPGGSRWGFSSPAWGGSSDCVHVFILPLKSRAMGLWSGYGIGPSASVETPCLCRLSRAVRRLHCGNGTFWVHLYFCCYRNKCCKGWTDPNYDASWLSHLGLTPKIL